MNCNFLSENAVRQFIDSSTVFDEYCRIQQQARAYSGGMYWKRQGEYEYLVKTGPDNQQKRLGPRSEATEAILSSELLLTNGLHTRPPECKRVLPGLKWW